MKTIIKSSAIFLLLLFCLPIVGMGQKKGKERMVEIVTNLGSIKIKLYNETPLHRDNFINLAETGAMNGSIFHRVIKGFMIQGGGSPGTNGSGSIGSTITAEIEPIFYHKKGALSAARMGDAQNPDRKSSGSQFYIVHGKKFTDSDLDMMEKRANTKYTEEQRRSYKTIGGSPHLDGAYTVFGEVVEGMDIVDKIAAVQVRGSFPIEPISIELKIIK
jgi:peptidyl-prolyl cis-trans isomerase B (cyclophilin B)